MKKRIPAIVLAFLMLIALLTACGDSGKKYIGIYPLNKLVIDGEKADLQKNTGLYTLNRMTIDGEDYDLKAFAELIGSSVDAVANMFSMELKSGGKGTLTLGDDATEVTWKVHGKKISITAEGETIECTIKNGTITFEEDGATLELTMDPEQYAIKKAYSDVSIELKAGGKAEFTKGNDTVDMTWKVDGTKITLYDKEEGETLKGMIEDDVITIEDDDIRMVFIKED